VLTDYNLVIEELEKELLNLNKSLAEFEGIDHYTRHRVFELGMDMVTFSEYFLEAHINATAWITDSANNASRQNLELMIKRNNSISGKLERKYSKKLEVCYKSFFFFIRAFHDAGYAALLNIKGQDPGRYSSMSKCIEKKPDKIYELVESIDGYVDWFKKFKVSRDKIKEGAKFNIVGPQWDVGICFAKITKEGGISSGGYQYRISDLIMALKYSLQLILIVKNNL
jgi:hypothetical protein